MTPVVAAVAFFIIGFVVGRRKGAAGAAPFSDPDVQHDMAAKAHEVVAAKIQKRKARIMEQALARGRITNDDVEDMFCISDTTARRYLDELEHEGKLGQAGESGRGVFYTPK